MGNKLTRMDLVKVVSTTIFNVQAPIRAQSFLTVSARKPLFILTMVLSLFSIPALMTVTLSTLLSFIIRRISTHKSTIKFMSWFSVIKWAQISHVAFLLTWDLLFENLIFVLLLVYPTLEYWCNMHSIKYIISSKMISFSPRDFGLYERCTRCCLCLNRNIFIMYTCHSFQILFCSFLSKGNNDRHRRWQLCKSIYSHCQHLLSLSLYL